MTTNEFEKQVNRTWKASERVEVDGPDMELLHGALLLTGESGEFADAVKKYIMYGQKADIPNMVEELGDIIYGVTAMCEVLGVSLDYVMANNVSKLQMRYPEGYSDAKAKERLDKVAK